MTRVATWNLERPQLREVSRRARLREAMAAINADIWVLTESHDVVTADLGFHVHASSTPDRSGEAGERWVTLASRFPVEPLATTDEARTAAALIRPPSTPPIIVFGSVLPWLGSPWQHAPAADGVAFAAALDVQLADWRRLQSATPDAAFVLAGDLNQDLAARHVYGSRRNRAALEAALAKAALRCLSGGADDPVPQHAPERASIDHICVDARLTPAGPLRSWPREPAPPRALSDHFGLVAELVAA